MLVQNGAARRESTVIWFSLLSGDWTYSGMPAHLARRICHLHTDGCWVSYIRSLVDPVGTISEGHRVLLRIVLSDLPTVTARVSQDDESLMGQFRAKEPESTSLGGTILDRLCAQWESF